MGCDRVDNPLRRQPETLADRGEDPACSPGDRRTGRSSSRASPASATTSCVTSVSRATAARKVARPSIRTLFSSWEAVTAREPLPSARSADRPDRAGASGDDDGRSGAVAEQPGRAPVVEVEHAAHQLGADREHRPRAPRLRSPRRRARAPRESRCRPRRRRSRRRDSAPIRSATSGAAFGTRSSAVEVATRIRSTSAGARCRRARAPCRRRRRRARRAVASADACRRSRTPVRVAIQSPSTPRRAAISSFATTALGQGRGDRGDPGAAWRCGRHARRRQRALDQRRAEALGTGRLRLGTLGLRAVEDPRDQLRQHPPGPTSRNRRAPSALQVSHHVRPSEPGWSASRRAADARVVGRRATR